MAKTGRWRFLRWRTPSMLKLAKTLYARYKTDVQKNAEQSNLGNGNNNAAIRAQNAYMLSSFDPVEARLQLETEYVATLSEARQWDTLQQLSTIQRAMYSLDLSRAQQMAETIAAHDPDSLAEFYCQDMRYLLMTRAQRMTCLFSGR